MSHYPHIHRRADDPSDASFDRIPPGMTADQLEFFTEQTERAVRKGTVAGVRHYRNQALVAFVLLLAGFLFNANTNRLQDRDRENLNERARAAIVDSGRAVAVDSCNRAYEERLKIRDVFLTSQSIVRARVDAGDSVDPVNDRRALDFYAAQLEAFKLPDCRDTEALLTDDPNKPVPTVEPWYESNENAPVSVFDAGRTKKRIQDPKEKG
jgi:hypothetical protein